MSKMKIIAVVFILFVVNLFVRCEGQLCVQFVLFFICVIFKKNIVLVPQNAGPVQLLDFSSNDEKTVLLMEDSIEKLFMESQVYDRDVVVVSIAGAFRKGKSFLMNYMLRYLYANVSWLSKVYEFLLVKFFF